MTCLLGNNLKLIRILSSRGIQSFHVPWGIVGVLRRRQHWRILSCRGCAGLSTTNQYVHNMVQEHVASATDLTTTGSLETLLSISPDSVTPVQLVAVTEDLVNTKYSSLRLTVPWLHENVRVARLQMLMMKQLQEFMRPVTSHPSFTSLQQMTMGQIHNLEADQVAKLLRLYLCLGMEYSDPDITTLLIECHKNIPILSGEGLSHLTFFLGGYLKGYFLYGRKIIKRLLELTELQYILNKPSDFPLVLQSLTDALTVCSSKVTVEFLDRVRQSLEYVNLDTLDASTTLQLLRFTQRGYLHCDTKGINVGRTVTDMFNRLSQTVKTNLDSYPLTELCVICHYLKVSPHHSEDKPEMLLRFVERAKHFLKTETSLPGLINMANIWTQTTPAAIYNPYLATVKPFIADLDIHLLAELAHYLCFCNPHITDPDIVPMLHKRVQELGSRMVYFDKVSARILKFLMKYPFTKREDEARFVKMLTTAAPKSLFFTNNMIMMLYITSTSSHLPDSLVEELLTIMTHRGTYVIPGFVELIRSVRRQMYNENSLVNQKRNVSIMENRILGHMGNKMEEVKSINVLYKMASNLLQDSPETRNAQLLTKILDQFENYVDCWIDKDVNYITRVLAKTAYYRPFLLDHLQNHLVDAAASRSYDYSMGFMLTLQNFVSSLAEVGYRPDSFEDFVSGVILKPFNSMLDKNLGRALFIMQKLCFLQIYPEKELKQIFSVDFLQKVDEYIRGQTTRQRVGVHRSVAYINRDVFLECPHLGVPWFHENWFKKSSFSSQQVLAEPFKMEIDALLGILLGPGKHKVAHRTAYGHNIDFLIVLDPTGKPVDASYAETTDYGPTRVAVLFLTPRCYCINTPRLITLWHKTIQQLEILDYRVVTIPHFEWFSLSKVTETEKMNYLKKKIFDT